MFVCHVVSSNTGSEFEVFTIFHDKDISKSINVSRNTLTYPMHLVDYWTLLNINCSSRNNAIYKWYM